MGRGTKMIRLCRNKAADFGLIFRKWFDVGLNIGIRFGIGLTFVKLLYAF